MTSDSESDRPLGGLNIMVTRPFRQATTLAEPLSNLGATVIVEPMIEILPPKNWDDIDRAIKLIAEGRASALVFVSVNGVSAFAERMAQSSQPVNLNDIRVVGIGSSTCSALEERGIRAQSVPGKSDSDSVADFLIEQKTNGMILIIRADRGSSVLPDRLKDSQVDFQQFVAYRSVDRRKVDDASIKAMESGQIDWVTVSSSAIAGSLVRNFGNALNKTKLVSISPTTTKALCQFGYSPTAEAVSYNMSGIVDAIVAAEKAT